jgi:HD superfamily phosphodiesterase
MRPAPKPKFPLNEIDSQQDSFIVENRVEFSGNGFWSRPGDCESRIGHLLKVHGYAKAIGELEGLDPRTQFILEAAALTHDIGIKPSIEKYGNSSGANQEKEGPLVARPMLEALGYENSDIDRICFLIGHHHTYDNIDGVDYQILIEADFLVNLAHFYKLMPDEFEKYAKLFKTGTGKHFLHTIYPDKEGIL